MHCLTFLGIEINTRTGTLCLPADKLARLKATLVQWSSRRSCQRRQLESLIIGTLQHACRVVKPGRTFLRRMIDLLRIPGATEGHHHIRLNRGFRADLQWWGTLQSTGMGTLVLFHFTCFTHFSLTMSISTTYRAA